ncbi:VOC family protein [Herbaspirillum seropedicae]|uniref:VOC family protein n=1 Tax=Herbaspirillum seropedicae TaxID=964 RepID=UPI0008482A7C|nr:VOC family protein [Herbaspirillum seropedicae]AON53733.1 glyoxalase/bleomycin resistance protein/dioxygenase [Herbaspirillum seropedicae]
MSSEKIAMLGHVGIHVTDMDRSRAFYRDVLKLTITDMDPVSGATFFSSRPEEEHHELLLAPGRTVKRGEVLVQQVSFRCNTLEEVIYFYKRLLEADAEIEQVVTHGNAIGVYFFDPDGNRCEVYWDTGLASKQPFKVAIDLTRSPAEIVQTVQDLVKQYGETGVRLT